MTAAAEEHFRKLERMYAVAPINRFFAAEISVSEGSAELTLPVRPDYFHSGQSAHGAVYFKLLDDSAYFAAASLVRDCFLLTVSFNIYFTRPVTGGVLKASGRAIHRSRNFYLAESELTDERGRSVARGSGSFMRSALTLGPDVGYV
jgi:uncharacterized protein (TIGR00369 family)